MKRQYEPAGAKLAGIEPDGILLAGSGDFHIIFEDGVIVVKDFEEEYFEDYTF